MRRNHLIQLFIAVIFCAVSMLSHADVVDQRIAYETEMKNNPFLIYPYEPTYILPAYYTQKPYYSIYENNTPDNEKLNDIDFKFQFSFKVPVWQHLFNRQSSLFFAYSQLSYWQAYNDSAFFRETNYQPEIFLANYWNKLLADDWRLKFVNFGLMHQSNGRGGDLERTWNRAYAKLILAHQQWMVTIQPWYVFRDGSTENHNPDITHYLGYGQSLVAYKYHQQTFSLNLQNEVESGFRRGAETFAWSFPLSTHLKGYIQVFSGFGQSLIEYNHYTNAVGIGIALNDWI